MKHYTISLLVLVYANEKINTSKENYPIMFDESNRRKAFSTIRSNVNSFLKNFKKQKIKLKNSIFFFNVTFHDVKNDKKKFGYFQIRGNEFKTPKS